MTTKDKIDKIEENKKAKTLIKKAQNSTNAKKTRTRTAKKPTSKVAAKTVAKKQISKENGFALGMLNSSAKKIAKIEIFFAKFIKNAKEKNDFLETAILKHIKKYKKKAKKS